VVTETEPVARALDEAAKRWPSDAGNRAKLLLRLVAEGRRAVSGQSEVAAHARREAIARTDGTLTGAYGEGYLGELREDWPA